MYQYEAVVRAIMEERMREAEHQRLTHVPRRRQRPSTVPSTPREPQRHSWLWSLAHPHQAHG